MIENLTGSTDLKDGLIVPPPSKITSGEIKIAVLSNYRFKKQQISADEVGFWLGDTDVSALGDGLLTEIEIKVSKSDLFQGEKKKAHKHKIYKECEPLTVKRCLVPNYFWICVPTALVDDAKKWVEENNPNYGVYEYKGQLNRKPEDQVYVSRRAKLLHSEKHGNVLRKIAKRLSSANITLKSTIRALLIGEK